MVGKQGKKVYENFLVIWFVLASKFIIEGHFYKINYNMVNTRSRVNMPLEADVGYVASTASKRLNWIDISDTHSDLLI